MANPSMSSARIYRLDQFTVPKQARQEFLARVNETHELLRNQSGFVRDPLLERSKSDAEVIIATLVEWRDREAVENARAAVVAMHGSTGFNPPDLMTRLGIKAEIGSYVGIDG